VAISNQQIVSSWCAFPLLDKEFIRGENGIITSFITSSRRSSFSHAKLVLMHELVVVAKLEPWKPQILWAAPREAFLDHSYILLLWNFLLPASGGKGFFIPY